MKVGYCRVSTQDQNMDAQLDALKAMGCEKVYQEKASGAKSDRRVLKDCLNFMRRGDVLVCYKLDRIARSLKHLMEIMEDLDKRGIGFISHTEAIDTTTPSGRLLFHLLASIGEFERDLIRQRTHAGLSAARRRGRIGGRPRQMTEEKVAAVKKLLADGMAVKDAAAAVGVSVPTLYRWCPSSER